MPHKITDIAKHLQTSEIYGNSHGSTDDPKDISFVDKESNIPKMNPNAKVVLISKALFSQLQTPNPATSFIITDHPRISFAKALELFDRPKETNAGIDTRSWVESGAEIDPTAVIYPFASIRRGAKIGKRVILYPGVYVGQDTLIDDDCIIYPNVSIFPKTKIGKRVILHAGSVVGDDGFGYVWDGSCHYKIPQVGRVVIEDDVELGSNAAIDRATTGETHIKRGTKIDNMVQIGHNVRIDEHCILCGQVGVGGSAAIGAGAMIGGQAGVGDHVHVDSQTKIAAQTGVITDTPNGGTLVGFPAMPSMEFFRTVALWKKLPELQDTIKKLQKEVDELKKSS